MLVENPELALMGSCVLVMLMKGEDVYVMNVGDSRAVLGQKSEPDLWSQDLEKINEETWYDLEVFDADIAATTNPSLTACQLSMDHSTSIEEEVQRIKCEHPDDPCAVMNDRVKGSLKVTRAFGAGFLKQSHSSSSMATPPEKEVESLSLTSSSSTSQMSAEEKYNIVRSIGEECIQEEELRNLLAKKPQPICYDGFEPSGRMHIAQGVMKTINVNKMTSAGCKVKIWIADWFAQLNNKMDGDLKKIRVVGEYLIEIWKAAGMDLENIEFIWSSDEINSRAHEYWPLVMDIARRNNLARITRCCQIMGRNEKDDLTAAQIFYPCMQCADVFFLKADICQLGMDQRKVNVLAREYCDAIKRKNKPIILSHHMLPGLLQGQEKMSKSDSSSAVFMEDEEAEVNVKIKKAYCPPGIVEGNPCLEYIKYIVFPWFNEFKVERKEENGGAKVFANYEELVADYAKGDLHPADLKPALSKALNQILQPVRDHFKNDENAKALLKKVKSYKVTK